jgi:hypothetical protein
MAWHSFFTFNLGNQIIYKSIPSQALNKPIETDVIPVKPSYITAGQAKPHLFSPPETATHELQDRSSELEKKEQYLRKKITLLDRGATYTQAAASFMVSLLSLKEFIKNDEEALNITVGCLNIVVPAIAVLVSIILKNESANSVHELHHLVVNKEHETRRQASSNSISRPVRENQIMGSVLV